MAQAKNNFLKSRMNKDLDARVLPQGEYRNALNIQVSRSESDSVGSLENVLGNELLINLQPNSKVIGYFADEQSSVVYFFVTNYLDPNPLQPTYDSTKTHGIYSYNTLTDQSVLLVSGSFLNFSQSNPIYGVNCLEQLLFWTDNRNQPRKINTVTASETTGYYVKEEQLSVAKNFPYQSMELWQEIIFLKTFCKGKYVVENVKAYYEHFIPPTAEIGRHYFWANFKIPPIEQQQV